MSAGAGTGRDIRLHLTFRPAACSAERAYLEARVRGIRVTHSPDRPCKTFDSVESPGVFRNVGEVLFDKTARRWIAHAHNDCTSEELALLIGAACWHFEKHGTKPGQSLRGRVWNHFSSSDGHPFNDDGPSHDFAQTWICYRLGVEDLQAAEQAREDVPDTIESLTHLVDEHYDELLREAGVDL